MSAVSLINPYAPQPVAPTPTDTGFAAIQTTPPPRDTAPGNNSGNASDQSGAGTGNGTGTGGAQLTFLLDRARGRAAVQQPTPKSVIEAQSDADPATAYLERQAQQRADTVAAERERARDTADMKAAEAKARAAEAAEPEFEMPNPLPTAPILQRDNSQA